MNLAMIRAARLGVMLGLLLAGPLFSAAAGAQGETAGTSTEGTNSNTGNETTSPANGAQRALANPLAFAMVQAGPIDAALYRLGPGDLLSLEMSGRLARAVTLPVDAEGLSSFPELGVVRVGGRTLADVRAQVLGKLRATYPGVRVDLRLVHLRTFKVYVSGQVKIPGASQANGATRASEVLQGALALISGGSRRNIELRHADGTRERVDLDAFAFLGRTAQNPYVLDGDMIYVPPLKERIYAFGSFGRSGEFELAPGDSVAELVALAGGLLPGTDASSGVLYRFTSAAAVDSFPVALDPAGGGRRLENGDRLFAREASDFKRPRNVSLVGELVFPGPYAVREGVDRVSDVLARAGGLTGYAARERIQIFRPVVTAGSRRDLEFERLSRLSRSEMTDAEYQTFKTKLAGQEASYVLSVHDLESPDNPRNIRLKDGDVLLVDRESHAVRVDGQVLRPSLVEYVPGRTVWQYIELAGGLGHRASSGKIRLTRVGSNQTLYVRDVKEVQPGDLIWIPEKNDVSFWSVFKDVITVAGSAAAVVIVVRGR